MTLFIDATAPESTHSRWVDTPVVQLPVPLPMPVPAGRPAVATIPQPRQPVRLADPVPADYRDPEVRLAKLLDDDTLVLLHDKDSSGVSAVRGELDGVAVVAFCTDATRMGGAMGTAGCRHIVHAIETAIRERVPVVGIWHSGGARLCEGVAALDSVGSVFAAMTRASGKILQLSVVLGPAAGGAAYGPALTDVVIMCPEGRMFVTGPDVVRSVTGEQVDMEQLGGPSAHGRKSGVVHILATSEEDAYARARRVSALLSRPLIAGGGGFADDPELAACLPVQRNRAYNVKPLIDRLLDGPLEELQARWAPNIVVGLGRLGGRAVGVIANNPLRLGGCLDSASAEKGSRFIRMCDALGVPLLVIVDVPGYLPGVGQEWDGVLRRGAKMLHAFAEAVVPRVTLVTRKAYGGAYIAMNSKSLGATAVFAWPDAEIAVMGARAAVGILHRRRLTEAPDDEREALHSKLSDEHAQLTGGIARAVELCAVDAVIDPSQTRRWIAKALASAPSGRGVHGNIPL